MRRGEIRLVDLDPVRPGVANRRRPAVVVSNDDANAIAARLGRGVVTVVPVTGNVTRLHRFQVFLDAGETGLDHDSKAQAEQIRAVAVGRVGPVIGRLGIGKLVELEEALRLHLNL
ncbi:type II toxin-antitoxin system PemK/MazF family toxin [Arachnia propionica]|uniref:mRNA interferase n=1 Tax=Arachnia propionica TaxID=1750 RepID=A0A3P1T0X8_9ACTN|nr:type II toxin-antitoxin system PemK/MazF family toxin [Arachnia propionica]RRD03091.1 type II toxin-antitoxin system PemK/MazF family toxin [Arachnia propionica]